MTSHGGGLLPFLRDGGGVARDGVASDRVASDRVASDRVARRGAKLMPRAIFLAEIEDLAQRLPDRPHVVNFCADRYRFTVAWAAAMLRGQVTLLPSRGDAGAVEALRADYPALYVLTDDDAAGDLPGARFAYPALPGAGNGSRVPAFPPDRIAAVLFTSGSTGRPNPSPRRWGRLVAGSLAAGAALGVGRHPGAALVATVPHAHSYGLESAVMLPLQHGLLLTAERPFFPADVAAALGVGQRPGILVTTPVHLRALVGDATGHGARSSEGDFNLGRESPSQTEKLERDGVNLKPSRSKAPAAADHGGSAAPVRAGFVLSATAPLSGELAARAEAAFGAPVFEIYGCSEAGQLATRRTVEGPVWRCLKGFELRQDAAGTWAHGPDEDAVPLADEIELTGRDEFILHGRTADTVNVAGKRSSLAYLTRQLTAIDGVEDGVFLLPETAATGAPQRLVAVVVAPNLDAVTILAALRRRIDAAFLPRPLHVVDALPRNGLGKLPVSDILRLIGAGPAETVATNPTPILLRFPADHPAGPGHFPGNPVVPGAMLLDALAQALFPSGRAGRIEFAKFHHSVRPGDTVAVTCDTEGDATRFEGRCAGSERLVLSGRLVLSSALRPTFPSR